MRTVGKTSASGRAKGSRTVAGTMVFVLTDHHPLLDLLPGTLPNINPQNNDTDMNQWVPIMLSDEFPPFDLNVILLNEYGYATMLTLYGVEIVDEGGVLSVDSVLSELVVQYTAYDMDPIIQVKPDENGNYDFAGVYSNEYVDLWRRREKARVGALHGQLEDEFDRWWDEVFSDDVIAKYGGEEPRPQK